MTTKRQKKTKQIKSNVSTNDVGELDVSGLIKNFGTLHLDCL